TQTCFGLVSSVGGHRHAIVPKLIQQTDRIMMNVSQKGLRKTELKSELAVVWLPEQGRRSTIRHPSLCTRRFSLWRRAERREGSVGLVKHPEHCGRWVGMKTIYSAVSG